jgi:hypothetical protein
MDITKIDKAVFFHMGSQIYACHLFYNDQIVGNMTDTHGAFIPEVKELLTTKYPGIQIEMK